MIRTTAQFLVFVFALLTTSMVFAADTYTIDSAHTTFGFTVKHMMISNVPGEFDKFSGQIVYSPTVLANSQANVTIDASSINTHNDNVTSTSKVRISLMLPSSRPSPLSALNLRKGRLPEI